MNLQYLVLIESQEALKNNGLGQKMKNPTKGDLIGQLWENLSNKIYNDNKRLLILNYIGYLFISYVVECIEVMRKEILVQI